jgi:hypothetical protein
VLDRLDEVGIHDKLGSVQARHVDHLEKLPILWAVFGFLLSRDDEPTGRSSGSRQLKVPVRPYR